MRVLVLREAGLRDLFFPSSSLRLLVLSKQFLRGRTHSRYPPRPKHYICQRAKSVKLCFVLVQSAFHLVRQESICANGDCSNNLMGDFGDIKGLLPLPDNKWVGRLEDRGYEEVGGCQ